MLSMVFVICLIIIVGQFFFFFAFFFEFFQSFTKQNKIAIDSEFPTLQFQVNSVGTVLYVPIKNLVIEAEIEPGLYMYLYTFVVLTTLVQYFHSVA